jgi:hypothetical protein
LQPFNVLSRNTARVRLPPRVHSAIRARTPPPAARNATTYVTFATDVREPRVRDGLRWRRENLHPHVPVSDAATFDGRRAAAGIVARLAIENANRFA